MNGLGSQRLIGLFCVGALLFNFPLLALWDRNALLMGLPLFPVALFGAWALLIAGLAWIVEHIEDDEAAAPAADAARPLAPTPTDAPGD